MQKKNSLCRELSAGFFEGKLEIGEGREMSMDKAWAGVDAGKEFHWACVLDASGRELLSRKVENDEADILKLIDETLSLAEEVAVSAVALRLGRVNHPFYVFDCMLGPRYMGKNACSSVR